MHTRKTAFVFVSRLTALLTGLLAASSSMEWTKTNEPTSLTGELPRDMQQLENGFEPVVDKSHGLSRSLKGVWRSHSYGFVLDLTGRDVEVYVEAGKLCWHTGLGQDSFFRSYTLSAYRIDGSRQVTFVGGPGGTQYTFQRLSGLPFTCREKLPVTPALVFDAFWEAMNERYAFFRLRNIDWRRRGAQYRTIALTAKNEAELYDVLKSAIRGFGDGHLRIEGEFDGKKHAFREVKPKAEELLLSLRLEGDGHMDEEKWNEWQKSHEDAVERILIRRGAARALNGHILWGLLDHNTGYIALDSMQDFGSTTAEEGARGEQEAKLAALAIDQALTTLADTRSLIVDISQNRGGDDRIARVIASRFTDRQRHAYTKHVPGGANQGFYLYPAGPRQFRKPIYLLTSRLTGSAAEVFALAMHALPNVCQVGESTGGAFSDVLKTPLPNGFLLTLSNEVYSDRGGKVYERNGVPPDLYLNVFPISDSTEGHLDAIRTTSEFDATAATAGSRLSCRRAAS